MFDFFRKRVNLTVQDKVTIIGGLLGGYAFIATLGVFPSIILGVAYATNMNLINSALSQASSYILNFVKGK